VLSRAVATHWCVECTNQPPVFGTRARTVESRPLGAQVEPSCVAKLPVAQDARTATQIHETSAIIRWFVSNRASSPSRTTALVRLAVPLASRTARIFGPKFAPRAHHEQRLPKLIHPESAPRPADCRRCWKSLTTFPPDIRARSSAPCTVRPASLSACTSSPRRR
jgi:hypothetical protein